MRLAKRHLTRVLQRKLDSDSLTDEAAAKVRAVLCDQTGKALDKLMIEARKLPGRQEAMTAAVSAAGDHPVLDWLESHWSQILSAIVAIVELLHLL